MVDRFISAVADVKDTEEINNTIRKICKSAKKAENRFCYYIGGTDDAATGLLNEVSGPISRHLPAKTVCQRVRKKDQQVCELRYEEPLDLSTMDLEKQRVKTLKKILSEKFDDGCKGCLEKSDFIRRIRELAGAQHNEL
eukprot:m.79436 g.79436  ORF g.79436 m.79436 type:complete len:139 (-) comp8182_c2_seq1:138-554(-)